MLSIHQCRALLKGHTDLTDQQIEALRDHFYELASLVIDKARQDGEVTDER
jgi:hypothetical protein